ncbi:hypothetical protein ACFS5J_06830 [Flavobacterium chuncheonense]|uniref:Uncharacterized protein n=1 Tax=Flavobacterium chuncheonense TaxID=2026653 RepID=A0ABW5YLC9_9FLAO
MAVTPNSGAQISLTEAETLVDDFKAKFPSEIKASFIGIENVQNLLKQDGCIGIRMYYGYDNDAERLSPVFVGVNSDGEDMIDLIMDRSVPCPPDCDANSPLNR